MLKLFFVEFGLLLILVALSFIPKINLLMNERNLPKMQNVLIMTAIAVTLINTGYSVYFDDYWGFLEFSSPYNVAAWTILAFVIIYLYMFREINLGGLIQTKDRKWSQLTDAKLLELYALFIEFVSGMEVDDLDDPDSILMLYDIMVESIDRYSLNGVSNLKIGIHQHEYEFQIIKAYAKDKRVAELFSNLNTVVELKKGA